tara:strand:- start:11 stop:1486 length:1476 start_codon:yes stop_codon:yes gene_type:complete
MSELKSEIDSLISGNRFYTQYAEQWQYLLVSYLGGVDYRQAELLHKYQMETNSEYNNRLHATPLDNHCSSVVQVYNSFLFREPPTRNLNSLSDNPDVESFLQDADLDGRSLNAFMSDVSTWSSVFGHCWLIVSKPEIGALTRADEIAAGVRPYVSLLTPLSVLDWHWARRPSGRYELDYFRYVEDINGSIQTIKEWTNEEIKTYVVDVEKGLSEETFIESNGLGRIPAVIAYNGRSMIRGIGVSDINDIADAQKLIYNLQSEVEQSVRLDSHPSLVTTPDTQIGTGPGSLIHINENLEPGLKPYLLEFSGASVASILQTIQHVTDSIDKMANTGAVRATEARTLSGVAMQTEFQLLNARLSEKANALELAEEQLWKLFCEYQDQDFVVEIDYPGSFSIQDTGNQFQQLKTAKETAQDPQVHSIIDQRLWELLGEDPDNFNSEVHPVTTSANRSEHLQTMIMDGYEDSQILAIHSEISQADIDQTKNDLLVG